MLFYIDMDANVFARYPPHYSSAVLSSVKFKVKELTAVFNTAPLMCFRFMR